MRASIEEIQSRLRELHVDGWLLHVFRDTNPVAVSTLALPTGQTRSRRAYYWIPAEGEPRKLHHAIEPHTLAHLPGPSRTYLSYTSLGEELANLVNGAKKVAMEYSPDCLIPTVSWVDAGTIERIRSFGVEVVSSAELIQYFEACLTDEQITSHFTAADVCKRVANEAFEEVGRQLREAKIPREAQIQHYIMHRFAQEGLTTDHPPIVAVDANASDPHYDPQEDSDSAITPGCVLLIDLWVKGKGAEDIFADQTWMGYIGSNPPEKVVQVWELLRDARRAGFDLVQRRIDSGQPVFGWEVDDEVRAPIIAAGYGEYFFHRTGHSITTVDHGSGANIDNLETRELRPLIPRTLFSIEPGIYLPEFGMRSEYNVLIDANGKPVFAGGTDQEDLILVQV